jgi:uncharacterized membrane protein
MSKANSKISNVRQSEVKVHQEYYSGPFPHPEMLKQYEEIERGLVNRTFQYAENEQAARNYVAKANADNETRELIYSFWMHVITNLSITLLFAILCASGCYALYLGNTKTALGIFSVPVCGILIAMAKMPNRKRKTDDIKPNH